VGAGGIETESVEVAAVSSLFVMRTGICTRKAYANAARTAIGRTKGTYCFQRGNAFIDE
jgi:hypothetical protein